MRSLYFVGPGAVEWREQPEPALQRSTDALVRPIAVATCDLDTALVNGSAPFPGPFPLGHEGVAEVVAVGPEVTGVRVGERVIVPFQISCGTCERCRGGHTASCAEVPLGSMYGLQPFGGPWGGFLSDLVRVPWADSALVPLPPGADPVALASMSDNIADGWRAVGPYLTGSGDESVLVVGGGGPSIPFYAIGIAASLGAARIDYLDDDPARLAKAERLGARPLSGPDQIATGGYSTTVYGCSDPANLTHALRGTRPDGTCVCVAVFFGNAVTLPMLEMYTRGVTLVTGRVNARAVIPKVLDLVGTAGFDPGRVTDAVVDWADAPAALLAGDRKLVIHRAA